MKIPSHWLLLWLLLTAACEQQVDLGFHWRALKLGDDMAWAAKDYDDQDWDISGSTYEKGVFWVRFKVNFGEQAARIKTKGLHVISTGSYEAYWDGILIGQNGKVGTTAKEEETGNFISYLLLPDALAQSGTHTLALRVSNHHDGNHGSWHTFYMNEYEQIVQKPMLLTAIMYLLAGIYFIVGVYYLFLSIRQKKSLSTLIFSLLCFTLFALIVLEYLKFTYHYPYPYHSVRLLCIGGLTFLCSFLTPLFFLHYFDMPKRWVWIGFLLLALIVINIVYGLGYDYTAMNMSLWMWVSSITISIYAWYKQKRGSVLIFIVFVCIAFLNFALEFQPLAFLFQYDVSLFISYTILIIAILYLLAKQQRSERQAYEEALLRSARLQNELLKKNIQPHFIMNTLTSLMDWVEESPQKGVQFIEALASEFRLFSKMADEQLVPIEQEIELCKKYLEIMSYRKEIDYQWEQKGIVSTEQIPPAILHTIVENGVTHSLPNEAGIIRFVLTFEHRATQKLYTLSTFARNRKTILPNNKKQMGLDYIRARLKESYGTNWQLHATATEEGWETKITITTT
ncbi:MAG: histidine kinase [Bacteroidota bacterium]